jgi:hypothetical protein
MKQMVDLRPGSPNPHLNRPHPALIPECSYFVLAKSASKRLARPWFERVVHPSSALAGSWPGHENHHHRMVETKKATPERRPYLVQT